MRIVHLTASSFFGGPERQILGLATALPSQFTTTILSFSESRRCRPFLEIARQSGFDAAELVHDTPHFASAKREISAFLRGNFADVLVTHGYKSNLLGRLAARHAKIPIVSVSRGWTGENFKVWCYEALDRIHLRLMDRVVCVSAKQAERVLRAGVDPGRIRVIRNAIQTRSFDNFDTDGQTRLHAIAGGNGPIVLAAGRLSPEKGFSTLIEAAALIRGRVPGVRVVLFGEGSERRRLEVQIAQLRLNDTFRLAGFCNDLVALLPWADVVVLPSFTEGMPNIALEAGAAGVPVVATAVGGTPEVVIDGETGLLVQPNDGRALAERVVELLIDPKRAHSFGDAAQRRMRQEFSFEAQAADYAALFAEVAVERTPISREAACA